MGIAKKGSKLQIAMLASGGGTTIKAVLTECLPGGRLHDLVEPVCIIASRPDAGALKRPREVGIKVPTFDVVPPSRRLGAPDPELFGNMLANIFDGGGVDLFCQFGWLPLTPKSLLDRYPGINQHPGPVPAYGGKGMYGRAVHAARLNYIRATSGYQATVVVSHWVTPEYDKGRVIQYEEVAVLPDDTPETLGARALEVEWRTQIRTLAMLSLGTNSVSGVDCLFGEEPDPNSAAGRALAQAKARAIADYPHG